MQSRNTNPGLVSGLVWLLMALASPLASAAETGELRHVFACKYINGADRDDLMSARDNLVKAIDKLDLELNTYLWTPMVGTNGELDFLWQNHYPNLNALGATLDRYNSSSEGQSAQARFDEIVDCTSSINLRNELFNGGGELGGNPPVTISVASCGLKHGQSMTEDVPDFVTHLRGVLGATEEFETFLGFMSVPMVSQTDVDLRFIGVYNDATAYAAATTALRTSEAGQMLGRHFNTMFDCKNSLWAGERIIIPD